MPYSSGSRYDFSDIHERLHRLSLLRWHFNLPGLTTDLPGVGFGTGTDIGHGNGSGPGSGNGNGDGSGTGPGPDGYISGMATNNQQQQQQQHHSQRQRQRNHNQFGQRQQSHHEYHPNTTQWNHPPQSPSPFSWSYHGQDLVASIRGHYVSYLLIASTNTKAEKWKVHWEKIEYTNIWWNFWYFPEIIKLNCLICRI